MKNINLKYQPDLHCCRLFHAPRGQTAAPNGTLAHSYRRLRDMPAACGAGVVAAVHSGRPVPSSRCSGRASRARYPRRVRAVVSEETSSTQLGSNNAQPGGPSTSGATRVVRLEDRSRGAVVHLVGVSHVLAADAARDVRALLSHHRPDAVVLELCAERAGAAIAAALASSRGTGAGSRRGRRRERRRSRRTPPAGRRAQRGVHPGPSRRSPAPRRIPGRPPRSAAMPTGPPRRPDGHRRGRPDPHGVRTLRGGARARLRGRK